MTRADRRGSRGDRRGDRGACGRSRSSIAADAAEPRSIVALQRSVVGATGARPPRPSLALRPATAASLATRDRRSATLGSWVCRCHRHRRPGGPTGRHRRCRRRRSPALLRPGHQPSTVAATAATGRRSRPSLPPGYQRLRVGRRWASSPGSGSGSRAGCSTASCTGLLAAVFVVPGDHHRRRRVRRTAGSSTATTSTTRRTRLSARDARRGPDRRRPSPSASSACSLVLVHLRAGARDAARPGECGSRASGSCAPTTGCRSGSARRSGARCSPASCRPTSSTSATSGRRGTTRSRRGRTRSCSTYVVRT